MPPVSTTRPLTEEERALLREPAPRLFGWWTGVVSALCVFVLGFLVVALAPGADLNVTAKHNLTALMLAIVAGHAAVARVLVRARADLGVQGRRRTGLRGQDRV